MTGDNIYPSKVVFARELIQNSIDAIAVREAKGEDEFSKCIMIEIAKDEANKRYFKITDNGTGMDRYKIERYFTSIGRSFYSGEEYKDLNISYKPISNFGIGFLSSFMVCREIDVKTKYFLDNSEGLKLHIPNYDGCFFIELDKEANIGTEIKLYLDCDLNNQEMVDYIRRSMLDVKYNISVKYLENKNCEKKLEFPAHYIRELSKNEDFKFFIPLTDTGEVLDISYEEVTSNKYIEKYKYGILIRRESEIDEHRKHIILNAGILVEQASIDNLFNNKFLVNTMQYWNEPQKPYNNIYYNFPSNWLQVDVSRENVSGFTDMIMQQYNRNGYNALGEKLARVLYKQIISFEEYAKAKQKEVPLIYLQDLIQNAINFVRERKCSDVYEELQKLRYHLIIEFSNKGVIYKVKKMGKSKNRITVSYLNDNAKIQHKIMRNRLDSKETRVRAHKFIFDDVLRKTDFRFENHSRILDDIIYGNEFYNSKQYRSQLDMIINQLGFEADYENKYMRILELLTVLLLEIPENLLFDKKIEKSSIMFVIENVALHYLTVCSTDKCIIVSYEGIQDIFKIWNSDWI